MSRLRFALTNRIVWLQALTVLLLLLPVLGAGVFVWSRHVAVQSLLDTLEPRYARLLGMVEHKAELQTSGLQVREQLSRLAYPAGQDVTQAGNDAQQRIRALFADSKLNVLSIQVLPAKVEGQFDYIPISLRVEGDLTGMINALSLLASQTPMVVADEVTLQTVGMVLPASAQNLVGQFRFSVRRLHP